MSKRYEERLRETEASMEKLLNVHDSYKVEAIIVVAMAILTLAMAIREKTEEKNTKD